ncbi:lytic transglycosylase domain-containing protein [Nocardioides coralli]|uniref:aggregation-promoting factor C-terminal-like domain-containing protein n=1 Tax=Nocardioides coralli TaxID=2872154 RepID=UPI001CA430C7|nr:lytic transglycosylase domain-containing protein [Nocardioides coralli]QZY28530.1 lytic transglycosylase domain-containing protein [Nocardioides coralli]
MSLAKQKYVPRHRQTRSTSLVKAAPRTLVRNTAVFGTVAAAATGVAVTNGLAGADVVASSQVGAALAAPLTEAEVDDRAEVVSRSDSRDRRDDAKEAALDSGEGQAVTRSEKLSEADPRDIARALLPKYGFSADQFSCLDQLYISESNWRIDADNPTSSAYGIPQALTSMHDLPPDYYTSAEAQIRWGLDYIRDAYGSPCSAWSFKQANNWY